MFYGYCFPKKDDWHTPKIKLEDAKEAYAYCNLHHVLFEEIRITDPGDFLVLHVVNHIMKIPWPDGTFKYIDLQTGKPTTQTF